VNSAMGLGEGAGGEGAGGEGRGGGGVVAVGVQFVACSVQLALLRSHGSWAPFSPCGTIPTQAAAATNYKARRGSSSKKGGGLCAGPAYVVISQAKKKEDTRASPFYGNWLRAARPRH
jgi:hypothetical protein